VGRNLGIEESDLDLIESGGSNPSELLLEYAYRSVRPDKVTAGAFRKIILGFKKRTDLHDLMDTMGIIASGKSGIKACTTLQNYLDMCVFFFLIAFWFFQKSY